MTVQPVPTPERRQTPTERLHEVTLAALNRKPAEPESAVEVTRNAKGDYQFTVTVRGLDVQACRDEAVRLADELAAHFPRELESIKAPA